MENTAHPTAAITRYTVQNPATLFRFGSPLHGFDADGAVDYGSARATRLYEAAGASLDDEEMVLGTLPSGRWALVGLIVEGHSFSVEEGA